VYSARVRRILTKQCSAKIAIRHLAALVSSVSGNAASSIQKIAMKYGFFASSIARALYRRDVGNGACKGDDAWLTTHATNAIALRKNFCTERSDDAFARPESIKNERIGVR